MATLMSIEEVTVGRVLSPQEKKALSYAKDRRNNYGENDKSSRKNIRKRKRDPNSSDRHREHQVLAGATGVSVDLAAAESAELILALKKSKWLPRNHGPSPG